MHPALRRAVHTAFFARHRPPDGLQVIFRYHSIGRGSGQSESEELFRSQIRYLAAWFRVVRLAEFIALAAGDAARVACVTFDDGYVDNVTAARGILEAEGIPATFLVISGALGRQFSTAAGPFPLMTPEQVKALAAAGHEIGSHTVTHPRLTEVAAARVQHELVDSRRYLEDLLGAAVTSFAYPKGRVDAGVRRAVEGAGYRQAVTTQRAAVVWPVDPFLLPRLGAGDYIRVMLGRRR